jgi:hypothetical protein
MNSSRNRGKSDTLNIHIHDRPLSVLDTGISKKKWRGQISVMDTNAPISAIMRSCNNVVAIIAMMIN